MWRGCGTARCHVSCSVLVHSGGVNGGHYCAFIKPAREDSWFKFDDERVTRVTEQVPCLPLPPVVLCPPAVKDFGPHHARPALPFVCCIAARVLHLCGCTALPSVHGMGLQGPPLRAPPGKGLDGVSHNREAAGVLGLGLHGQRFILRKPCLHSQR